MPDDFTRILPPPPMPQVIGPDEAGRIGNLGAQPFAPPAYNGDQSGVRIDIGDGVVLTVGDDGPMIDTNLPAPYIRENREPPPFGENLAHKVPVGVLNAIAAEVIEGVQNDIVSRSSWMDQYNEGIDLLGLKVEDTPTQGSRRNVSRAGHPLLIEAMTKYWAAAAGEMLPAGGPVKVPTIGHVSDDEQQLADALEDDFNYYLTFVDRGYRPDTSQMLMQQSFCGIGYKKVFRDPLRRRPLSRSVNAPDLIVSEEATDLDTAHRVTHRIQMMKGELRRLQLIGQYRDVDIQPPGAMMSLAGAADRKIRESEGFSIIGFGRPADLPYEIWETDQEIDIDYHIIEGYWERKTPDGLPLPYKIALDSNSHEVLGLWRNWRVGDPLCMKRNMYVKFGLVPGLGFHNWGFLQLLGNQTRVLRSIWRILIDGGMLANFPGGVKNKQARTSTNEIAPGPGEFVDMDIPANRSIGDMFAPMPYKDVSANFVQLAEIIKGDAKSLAGTAQLEVGEGRANVPVGTIMSLLEEKVQVMAAVFKGNHDAQKEELLKIRELFAERPEDLNILCRERPTDPDRPRVMWQKAEEFTSLALQPASDPNIPARTMRLMSDNVAMMIAQEVPENVNVPAILTDVFRDIGKNPDNYVIKPQMQGPPPPDPKVIAETIKQQTAQSKQQTDAAMEAARLQVEREKLAVEASKSAADNQTDLAVAHVQGATQAAQPYHDAAANPPPIPGMTAPGGG